MIFIIIPVFNRKEFTRICLESLNRQTFKDFEVIVVDDGSTDGTSEMIIEEFPNVSILTGNGNLWWAGATNKGIENVLNRDKKSSDDFILTLNNDLVVPEHYLETLIKNAQVYKRSLLGSVSVDIADCEKMDFCGITWNEYTGRYFSKAKAYSHSYPKLREKKNVISSDMLPGRGTLIPITLFNEIGLFDSFNFPQYAADEDFALRAKRKGWCLLIPTDVYVMSHIDQTGIDASKIHFNLKYFKDLFFSIRSPLNLKIRYRFAMKNTRFKLFYFLIGLARITLVLAQSLLVEGYRKLKTVV